MQGRRRAEDETTPGGELLPRAEPNQSGWAPRRGERHSEIPTRQIEGGVAGVASRIDDANATRHMAGGVEGFVSRIDEIRRLYAAGETEEALLLASTVSPAPQLGWSLASIPVLALPQDEIVKMPLDHRAGFFLAHVDGESTLETILDLVPLPEGEVLALVESLVALGVIALEPQRLQSQV